MNFNATFPLLQPFEGGATPVRIFSESILVPMPFPDNSMPFNAITYVCTLIALTAGAIINLITMRPVEPKAETTAAVAGATPSLLGKLKGLFGGG